MTGSSDQKPTASTIGDNLKKFDDFLMQFPPRIMYAPLYYVVNFFKAMTLPTMLLLIYYYQNFSTGALLYASLHGAYGIAWILKHIFFADKSFDTVVPLGTNAVTTSLLVAYWAMGFLVINGTGIQDPSPERVFVSILFVAAGSAIMISSDAQKTYTLRLQKGLINTGWTSRTRNPNYLAEMILYSGFAVVSGVWASWIILGTIWSLLFLERIFLKEFSYRKKEGWEKYKKQSNILLPKLITNSFVLDTLLYCVIISGLVFLHNKGGITGLLNIKK